MKTDAATDPTPATFFLGEACIDPQAHRVTVENQTVKVQPRVMALLLELVQAQGHVVQRDTLFATVWADELPNDEALTKAISKLRKALGDQAHNPRYIETIPKVGYRLLVSVSDTTLSSPTAPPRTTRSQERVYLTNREPWLWGLVACLLIIIAVLALYPKPPLPRGLTADMKPRIRVDSTHQMQPPAWAYRIPADSLHQLRRRQPRPAPASTP